MAPVYTLDPDHFFLGFGCEKKHYWPGTEKSPRRVSNGQCFGCSGNRQASNWILRFVDHVASGIPDGCFLGKLCEKGHKWEGFAVSLKWRCSGGAPGYSRCIQCDLESAVEMPKIKQAAKKRPFNKVDRYCDENINILKELIAYDKTHPTGLVWIKSTDSRQPVGGTAGFITSAGDLVFWYAGTYLSVPKIILLLNNVLPKEQDANAACALRINSKNDWNDINNLRWGTRSEALRFARDTRRLELIRSVLGDDGPDLGDRLRLNAPCSKGHLWNGHQLGLQRRWGQSWRCDECSKDRSSEDQEKRKERNKKRYQENIEEERRKARERMRNTIQAKLDAMTPEEQNEYRKLQSQKTQEYFRSNGRKSRSKVLAGFVIPPHLIGDNLIAEDIYPFASAGVELLTLTVQAVSESRKLWYHLKNTQAAPTVAELVENQSRDLIDIEKAEFLEAGGTEEEWAKEYKRRYYYFKMATDTDYVLQTRERSRRRKVRIRSARRQALQPVTRQQIDARFALWNHRCAFCGVDAAHEQNKGRNRLTIEHVLALTKGGLDEASNILPSCLACNLGKHNAPVESWYRRQPFFTESRWRKIQRHCPAAVVGQLPLGLL